jgi:hypothetical protein
MPVQEEKLEETLTALAGTATPWLLGIFFALGSAVFFAALKNWREMKRSPYFFQRLQAGKRLQTYLSASFVLFLISMGVGAYSWQTPVDTTVRMAILPNSKPVLQTEESTSLLERVDDAAADSYALESLDTTALISVIDQPFVATQLTLPSEYDRFEPQAELNSDTNLGTLSFSTEVTDDYEAVSPRQIFAEGFYTLYATFSYEGMEDGMVWAWVWRLDGAVVEGGNEVWAYGDEGPGYIYFAPEEGFDSGRYSLDVWVNGELMAQSAVVMNSASVSANN